MSETTITIEDYREFVETHGMKKPEDDTIIAYESLLAVNGIPKKRVLEKKGLRKELTVEQKRERRNNDERKHRNALEEHPNYQIAVEITALSSVQELPVDPLEVMVSKERSILDSTLAELKENPVKKEKAEVVKSEASTATDGGSEKTPENAEKTPDVAPVDGETKTTKEVTPPATDPGTTEKTEETTETAPVEKTEDSTQTTEVAGGEKGEGGGAEDLGASANVETAKVSDEVIAGFETELANLPKDAEGKYLPPANKEVLLTRKREFVANYDLKNANTATSEGQLLERLISKLKQ